MPKVDPGNARRFDANLGLCPEEIDPRLKAVSKRGGIVDITSGLYSVGIRAESCFSKLDLPRRVNPASWPSQTSEACDHLLGNITMGCTEIIIKSNESADCIIRSTRPRYAVPARQYGGPNAVPIKFTQSLRDFNASHGQGF